MVKSPSGGLQAVRLFPRESCSCSFSQRCSHIMAVMLAVGLPLFPESTPKSKLFLRDALLILLLVTTTFIFVFRNTL